MADGKHCPNCGDDIGVWAVFSAALPNWVKCPHCGARLAYRPVAGLVVGLSVVALGLLAGMWWVGLRFGPVFSLPWITAYTAGSLAAWLPVEAVVVWYVRRYKTLSRAG